MIVTIHHSASDNPSHDNIETIDRWHRARGFSRGCGYHYFIRGNGTLEFGRNYWEQGAHCKEANRSNIGICLHGLDDFSDRQFDTLEKLLRMLHWSRILDSYAAVFPHKHFNSDTVCPGFDVKKFMDERIYAFSK